MIYPEFIKPGDKIAVAAPSGGIAGDDDIKKKRFNNAGRKLEERGYKVTFGENVFRSIDKLRSAKKSDRVRELMNFFADEEVKYIVSAKGGEMLMEILPYVDYGLIKENAKWFQGYSDNTGLTFSITTLADVATVYGNNFGDYGMDEWHRAVKENIELLEGKISSQESFDMYEDGFRDYISGLEGYCGDKPVKWSAYVGHKQVMGLEMRGRIIGGCFDVIMDIAGTRFEDFIGFADRYRADGIILYLESFYANTEAVERYMWKLRQLGWLDGLEGIIFGRPMFLSGDSGLTYEEAVLEQTGSLGHKTIFNADIGHKAPQFSIINGANVLVACRNNMGNIRYNINEIIK